jgi:trehalose synthase
VTHRALLVEDQPLLPDEPYVLQVSRWDALKDHAGVVTGFAEHVVPANGAHLVCAGPDVERVSDDPEGARVLAEVSAARAALVPELRARIHLAVLPMDDVQENGAIVNALQRRAAVVVQKSLAEGFGLTVAEAMWKSRPVIASRIGGIQDQIEDGRDGVLLHDPRDLAAFGAAVRRVLENPDEADVIARAGHERVRRQFLAPRSLLAYLGLIEHTGAPLG